MKFLHLTYLKNLNSIFKYGLIPTYIKNDSHAEAFNLVNNRKCIYLWDAETYKNEKYIEDLVYCKFFIHPRNDLYDKNYDIIIKNNLDELDERSYINFKKRGNKLFGTDAKFVILEIDSEKINFEGPWIHVQEPTDNIYSTTTIMNDKFSHNDKNIYICKDIINRNNIKIVGYLNTRLYKNNSLGFTFNKK